MTLPIYIHAIAVFSILIDLALIIRLLSKRGKTKNLATVFLVLGIFNLLLWVIFTHLNLWIYINNEGLIFNIIGMLANTSVLLGLMMLSLFENQMIKINPSNTRIAFFSAGIMSVITTRLIFTVVPNITDDQSFVISLIQSFFNITLLVGFLSLAVKDYRVLLQEKLSDKQRRQITTLYYSTLLGPGSMIPVIAWVTLSGNLEFISIGYFSVSITLVFILQAYLQDPRVAFILPEKAYLAIVVNSNGALKYSRNFSSQSKVIDEMLISAALSGITSLMSEFYKTSEQPRFIKFKDDIIQFRFSEYFFIAVFCSTESLLLSSALEKVVRLINKKFEDNIHQVMIDQTYTIDLDDVFEEAFYFIYS